MVVVITNWEAIVRVKSRVNVCCPCDAASVTWSVRILEPALVGVPVIAPLGFSVRPAGNEPATIVQAYGAAPPVAVNAWL